MKRKYGILNLGLLVIVISSALASERLSLPSIERKALLNGLQFLFFDGHAEKTPFLLMVKNGAAFDPSGKWGATYIMAQLMANHQFDDFTRQEMRGKGVSFDVEVGWDALFFRGEAPPDELEYALNLLAEMVVRPEFREEDFESVRSTTLKRLEQQLLEKVSHRSKGALLEELMEMNPYAHRPEGTPETLKNLFLRDIKIQYRRLIMPNQATIALQFAGERGRLFRRLSRSWGGWVRGEAAPFTFRKAPEPGPGRVILIDSPRNRCLIRWGYLGVSRSSRDYLAFKVLEQFLMLSLPDWSREISGTAQIRGSVKLVARKMPGFLLVSLESDPGQILAFHQKLIETLRRLRDVSVREERFQAAKKLVFQEYREALSTVPGSMREVLNTDLYELGVNFIPTYHLRLERLSPEVFQRTLNARLLPEAFVMVVAGPAAKIEQTLRQIGALRTLN